MLMDRILGAIDPVAFDLFGWPIRWYGIIIAAGILLAIQLGSREIRRRGWPEDLILDVLVWAIPIGFVGARLYYVIFEWDYYHQHLDEIIQIWNGGIAIYGGVLAALATIYIYCRTKGWRFLLLTDVMAPYLLLAQAIGRWGNFVNQEAHGGPVSADFLRQGLHLPEFIVEGMQIDGVYYHPTFLYESLWNLLGFALLLYLRNISGKLRVGETTFLYLIWYGTGRFFIEALRTDSLYWGPFRVSQVLSLILILIAVGAIIWRRWKQAPPLYQEASLYAIEQKQRKEK